MKKILISIALLGSVATGAFLYIEKSSNNTQKEDVLAEDEANNSNESNNSTALITDQSSCTTQQMFTPPTDEIDWTAIKLYMATSKAGVSFENEELFLEGGAVPSVTAGEDSQLIAVFNWFPNYEENPSCYNKVGVKISKDNGKTWSEPQGINVEDFPTNYQLPFDPTITTTEDGNYRLFFTTHLLGMDEAFVYGSAISSDGINYTYEEGTRFEGGEYDIVDGSEVRLGTHWYMIAPMAKKDGEALDAQSTDGKTFTKVATNRGDGIYWVGNMTNVDGSVRFYGSCKKVKDGMGKICYSSTKDGKVWSDPVVTTLPNSDPGIVYTGEGTFFAIYAEPNTGMAMPEDSGYNKR